MENFEKLSPELQAEKLQEIASEVRRYSGSPDFWRHGLKVPKQMSLVFMFFGARVAGVSTDLARLGGKTGYQKEAWANLAVFVGLPTLAAALMNYEPEERDYYEKQNEKERHDYYMIPRGIFYIDDNGEKRQEYFRIPKDDTAKIFSSMVESFVKFAYDKDPWIMKEFALNFIEDISPVSIHGEGFKERVESMVSSMNPLGKVPAELLMNRNMYFHTDIIPRKMENWSPQDQRRSTTPGLFIAAGKVLGVSPLFLEHATRGYTAGLFTQFIPRKAQAGRAAWTAIQPLNMFASSAYGGDDLRLKRLIEVKEIADADLGARFWEVEGRWLEMQHYKPTDFRRAINMIAGTDKDMAKRLIERRKLASLGWGYQDSVAMQLGVKNGARAKFIKGELDVFGDDKTKARAYMSDLIRKKIATSEVLKQVAYLKRRDKK